MNRLRFLATSGVLMATSTLRGVGQSSPSSIHGFPPAVLEGDLHIENEPIADYRNALASTNEAFRDMKFGVRIHWGIYSIWRRGGESWPNICN